MAEQTFHKGILDLLFDKTEVPQDVLCELQKSITTKEVKKGEFLQRRGDNISHSFFVTKGCLRSYSIDEKGKEHIFMFGPEGWIIADIESQTQNTPAMLYIDAVEHSEIEIFEKDFFEKARKTVPQINDDNSQRLLRRVSVLQKRIIMLMSATALERYQDFLQTYPDIVQRVPQKMIASYLGITPEALSKIRGKMSKKK